jgi:hypothetical protein
MGSQITISLPFSPHLANSKQYLTEEQWGSISCNDPFILGIRSALMNICDVGLKITEIAWISRLLYSPQIYTPNPARISRFA